MEHTIVVSRETSEAIRAATSAQVISDKQMEEQDAHALRNKGRETSRVPQLRKPLATQPLVRPHLSFVRHTLHVPDLTLSYLLYRYMPCFRDALYEVVVTFGSGSNLSVS